MTALPWTKLHTDILGDPKLMRAARKGAAGLGWTPWLFAFAARAGDAGRLTVAGEPAEPEDIAPLLPGATPADVAACLASLEGIGVLARDPDGALRLARRYWQRSRPAIPPTIRVLVFARDGARCRRCGATDEPLELDHILAWSRGGRHEPDNLQVLCRPCNRAKGAREVLS